MSENPSSDEELNPLTARLKELVENPEDRIDEEMVETVKCTLCGEEHPGEIFTAPPDGFKIRYWCPEEERRNRTSFT